jgi:hypothetical protein
MFGGFIFLPQRKLMSVVGGFRTSLVGAPFLEGPETVIPEVAALAR